MDFAEGIETGVPFSPLLIFGTRTRPPDPVGSWVWFGVSAEDSVWEEVPEPPPPPGQTHARRLMETDPIGILETGANEVGLAQTGAGKGRGAYMKHAAKESDDEYHRND